VAVGQGPLSLLLEPTGGVDPHGNALAIVLALRVCLDILKVADCPSEEVGRHDGGALKHNVLEARLAALLDLLLGHVAESDLVFRHFELDIEGGLEVWLVEAGEGSAGVAGLELGAEHVVELVIFGDGGGNFALGRVLGAVETSHNLLLSAMPIALILFLTHVVDATLELDGQGRLTRVLNLLPKVQSSSLALVIVRDGLCLLGSIRLELRALDLQLIGIEDDLVGALGAVEVEGDADGALVSKLPAELDVVDGEVVVRGLGPRIAQSALLNGKMQCKETHQLGRISLSDAIATRLLEASLEQLLNCLPTTGKGRAPTGLTLLPHWARDAGLATEAALLEVVDKHAAAKVLERQGEVWVRSLEKRSGGREQCLVRAMEAASSMTGPSGGLNMYNGMWWGGELYCKGSDVTNTVGAGADCCMYPADPLRPSHHYLVDQELACLERAAVMSCHVES
jgi:hypothetical protein